MDYVAARVDTLSVTTFTPTEEQARVLEHQGPLLVLAGAGVGKTTVLTRRIVDAIARDGVPADQILALTFTRAAAEHMRSRIDADLKARGAITDVNSLVASTYHAFASDIVREFGIRIGVPPTARLLGDAERWGVLDAVFDDLRFRAVVVRHAGTAFDSVLKFVASAQHHLLTPDRIHSWVTAQRVSASGIEVLDLLDQWDEMAAAYATFQERKLRMGALDFGDQILYAVKLLQGFPDVRAALRARHQHLYVDEYQDTNPAQRALLMELADPRNGALFVIGDDDQAIFRFQGANVRNILRLPQEAALAERPPSVLTLVGNRRSRPPILEAANAVAAAIQDRQRKELVHLRDGAAVLGAYVADSDRTEAAWIAGTIRTLQQDAASNDPLATFGNYAVLCRKRALLEVVHDALAAVGIPTQHDQATPLLTRWEIDEVRATLEAIATPDDDVALARIMAGPRWQIGDADLWALARWRMSRRDQALDLDDDRAPPTGIALSDAVLAAPSVPDLSDVARERLAELTEYLEVLADLAVSSSVADLIQEVITRGGFRHELMASGHADDAEALGNLDRLVRLSRSFGGDGMPGLRAFLRFLDRADEADDPNLGDIEPPPTNLEAVMVTTVHKAKGLEWDVVFVPGLAEGQFAPRSGRKTDGEDRPERAPYALRAQAADLPPMATDVFTSDKALRAAQAERSVAMIALDADDERRLMYVAVTRARERLYLSRAIWYGDRKLPVASSPFWDELLATGLFSITDEETPSDTNPNRTRRPNQPASEPDWLGLDAVRLERAIAAADPVPIRTLAGDVPPDELAAARLMVGGVWDRVYQRRAIPPVSGQERVPPITSYSALSTFEICARRYRYLYVDRLPTRPNPALAGGTSLHRLLAAAASASGDSEIMDPDSLGGVFTGVGEEHALQVERYLHSRFATQNPIAVEMPFSLALGSGVIRGTIDRVYRTPNETLEVVDFKTGRQRPAADLERDLQLPVYALAVGELYETPPERIGGALFFIDADVEWQLPWDAARATSTRARLEGLLESLAGSAFPLTENRAHCRFCDFRHICQR